MNRKEAIEYAKFRLECHTKGDGEYTDYGEFLVAAIEALQEPEIIHCKDCKLRKLEECAMQYECDCGEQHSWENDNDYCSWGIKAGEQNGQKRSDRDIKEE